MPTSESQAIAMGLRYHPTLKSAKEDMSAAYAQHQTAASPYYPKLDLQLSALRGQDISGIPGQDNQEVAQVLVNYNLFRGGADYHKRQQTAFLYQESADVMHNTYRQVVSNVSVSWDAMNTFQNQLPPLLQHQRQATQTFKGYEEQFQIDKRNLFELLDAQDELYDASRSYTTDKYNLMFSRYRLLNSMGVLLSAMGLDGHP
jgi:adhesin transport system outer membrane protein